MAKKDPYLVTLEKINKESNKVQKELQNSVNLANQKEMEFNASESQKARAWQEKMTKSSHQMEVADLRKAGLNPVLSVNNGAQSYTTSSASASLDSGASALGSLIGSKLGALSSLESSRLTSESNLKSAKMASDASRYSAEMSSRAMMQAAQTSAMAQMYASEMSYKASKYGANQSAAATRYAANQSAAAQKYSADTSYKTAVLNTKFGMWKVKNEPQGSWAGVVDKYLGSTGLGGQARTALKNVFNGTLSLFMSDKANFTNKKSMTASNYKLTTTGKSCAVQNLRVAGYKPTKKNIDLYVKAVVFHDSKALERLRKSNPNPRPAGGR